MIVKVESMKGITKEEIENLQKALAINVLGFLRYYERLDYEDVPELEVYLRTRMFDELKVSVVRILTTPAICVAVGCAVFDVMVRQTIDKTHPAHLIKHMCKFLIGELLKDIESKIAKDCKEDAGKNEREY